MQPEENASVLPETVIAILQTKLEIFSIHLIAQRISSTAFCNAMAGVGENATTRHFVLLVVAKQKPYNATADLQHQVSESCSGISVMLLLHSAAEVQKSSGDKRYFFGTAFRKAPEIVTQASSAIIPDDPVREFAASERYSAKSEKMAAAYIAAAESLPPDVCLVKIGLLRQAVEHLALGVIRRAWGYTPNQFDLSYLLALCETIHPETRAHFPRSATADNARFRVLERHPQHLRFLMETAAEDDAFIILRRQVIDFLTYVKTLPTQTAIYL